MTSTHAKFFSSLTDRVQSLKNRVTSGVVVGAVAVGAVVAGSAAVSAAPIDQSGRTGAHSAAEADSGARLATAGAVVSLAEKQVGIKADASGQTKFHQWFESTPDAKQLARRDGGNVKDYKGAAWCDMFVSWVGAQAGVKHMGRDAYTVAHAKWFQKTHRWGEKPTPGAVVFFSWNGGGTEGIDHVGLVVKDNGDGNITTVEGNTTGDVVAKKIRPTSEVVGYGYPEYAAG